MDKQQVKQALADMAKLAATREGYALAGKAPGHGRLAVWNVTKGGQTLRMAVKTSRDRRFCFVPSDNGKHWKTLDDADVVVVAAVDSKDEPQSVQVFIFRAGMLRNRFIATFKARAKVNPAYAARAEKAGVWICLDPDTRPEGHHGSGLAKEFPPVATYPLKSPDTMPASETVADILADARKRLAAVTGADEARIKLEMRLE